MANTLKLRGGTTPEVAAATLAEREIMVDTTKDVIVVGPDKNEMAVADGATFTGTTTFSGDVALSAGVTFGTSANANSLRIQNVGTPTAGTDAATKDYVDSRTQNTSAADIKTAYESNNNTNAFTDSHSNKLSGIDSNAQVNVKADWNQSSPTHDAYIQNKPSFLTSQTQVNWNQTDSSSVDFILNKPSLLSSIDEDDLVSDAADRVPTQQSVKAYVDGQVATALPLSGGTLTGDVTFSANQQFDGRDLSADGTKLDAIEPLAKDDQTGAEIKTLYEAESDTNAFTDAEQTKLGGIETLADVTDATNVAAAGAVMEGDTSTASMSFVVDQDDMNGSNSSDTKVPTQQSVKAYVDTSVAGVVDSAPATLDTLNELAAALGDDANFATTVSTSIGEKLPKAGGTMTGNIVFNSTQTFDGRDVSADGTKLDTIQSGAKDDQTGAEIKALYEAESNTNAFTDAQVSKLSGIETNATGDQTNAEIRAAVEAATDSNVFTDSDHSKLNGIAAGAQVNVAQVQPDWNATSGLGEIANKPTLYTDSDVDSHLNQSNPTSGNVLSWNGSDYAWVAQTGSTDLGYTASTRTVSSSTGNDVVLPLMVGASGNSAGEAGLVPAPTTFYGDRFLRGDGTWQHPSINNDVLLDTTPQLGGDLDVNGKDIVSTSNGNIELDPNGSGKVVFKGNSTKGSGQFVLNCENNSHGIVVKGPPHSANASYTLILPNNDGDAGEYLKTDGSGALSWDTPSGGSSTGDISFSTNEISTTDDQMVFKIDSDNNETGYEGYYFYGGPTSNGFIRYWINGTNQTGIKLDAGGNKYSAFLQGSSNFQFILNEDGGNRPVDISQCGNGSNSHINLQLKHADARVRVTNLWGSTVYYSLPRSTPNNGDVLTASDANGTLGWAAPSGGSSASFSDIAGGGTFTGEVEFEDDLRIRDKDILFYEGTDTDATTDLWAHGNGFQINQLKGDFKVSVTGGNTGDCVFSLPTAGDFTVINNNVEKLRVDGDGLTLPHPTDSTYDIQFENSGSGNLLTTSYGYILKTSTAAGEFKVRNGNDQNMIIASGEQDVKLYYGGSQRFKTTSNGAQVLGTLIAGGLTYPTSDGSSGHVLTTDGSGNLSFAAASGGSSFPASGGTFTGSVTFDAHTRHNDSKIAIFGDGSDLQIYHDSSAGKNYFWCSSDLEVRLPSANDFSVKVNGVEKFKVDSNYLTLPYSGSGDAKIFNSMGNLSFNGDGFTLKSNGATDTFRVRNSENDNMIVASGNGSVSLYHDSSNKLETTSTGVHVSGGIVAGGLTYPTSDGSNGQFLKTNGSGQLSWGSASGGGGSGVPASGGTFTGNVIFEGGIDLEHGGLHIEDGSFVGDHEVVTASGSTYTIDMSKANYFRLSGSVNNSTIGLSNHTGNDSIGSFIITFYYTGGTITWPTSFKWPGGTAPTFTTSKKHMVSVIKEGVEGYYAQAILEIE